MNGVPVQRTVIGMVLYRFQRLHIGRSLLSRRFCAVAVSCSGCHTMTDGQNIDTATLPRFVFVTISIVPVQEDVVYGLERFRKYND